MKLSDREVAVIVKACGSKFRSFGGGRDSEFNPLVAFLKDAPLCFAAMVSIEEVVRFVAFAMGRIEVQRRRKKTARKPARRRT